MDCSRSDSFADGVRERDKGQAEGCKFACENRPEQRRATYRKAFRRPGGKRTLEADDASGVGRGGGRRDGVVKGGSA